MKYKLISPIDCSLTPIQQVLRNRNIKDINHFLNVNENDINSPEELSNIHNGACMLAKHLSNGDKIFLQVDSDTDGYTSSALLINYLHCFAPASAENIIYNLHSEKEHGLKIEKIPAGTKLIICPDSSSNDYEEHKWCAEHGIDVLVLDHHEADHISENACIINNQLCAYPNKSFSGVGITYKFCKYIDLICGFNYADQFLDLVALGNIADMMDSRDYETQYYIQEGLLNIQNPYILEMGMKQSRAFGEGHFYMKDVAWYIAPYINAVTRLGTDTEKLLVFESMIEYKANDQIPSTKRGHKIGETELRVIQAGRVSTNIKSKQNTAVDNLIEKIELIIEDNNLLSHKILMLCMDEISKNKNLNGLVANKLANQYQRPCLVLQSYEDTWAGSARGYDKSGLKDFREYLLSTEMFEYCEGHGNAFGASIKKDKIKDFITLSDEQLSNLDGEVKYDVDFIWDSKDSLENDILNIADYYKLWGQQVDEPYVVIENIRLDDDTVHFIGKTGKTLKIDLPNGINIIKFFVTDEEKEKWTPNGQTMIANAICYCAKNEWNGNVSAQLKLEDLDIIQSYKYYF